MSKESFFQAVDSISFNTQPSVPEDGFDVFDPNRFSKTSPLCGMTNRECVEILYARLGLDNILDDTNDTRVIRDGMTERDIVINRFIFDAEQTIKIRLSKYFSPEALAQSGWIESRATWIAAYYISRRAGNEHYFEGNYTEAMRELDAIATGELDPPTDIVQRAFLIPAMTNQTVDERHYIEKLRVRPHISIGGTYPDQAIAYGSIWGWL